MSGENNQALLQVFNIGKDHEGKYKCEASNMKGTAKREIDVNVIS